MTKVMRSKPAKHHVSMIGKMVIVTAKSPADGLPDQRCGEYLDVYGSAFSMNTDLGILDGRCRDWTIEEIIETEWKNGR